MEPHEIGLVLALIFATLPAAGHGETLRQYDARGHYLGQSVARDGTERHYDAAGRYAGQSVTHGSETRHYDASGHLMGTERRR